MLERRFAGRFALVTGAASGIGRAVAEQLLLEGAEVIGADRNGENLRRLGDRSVAVELGSAEALPALRAALAGCPRVDVLVNAAGVALPGAIEEISLERWNAMLAANVTSMFLTVQAALPSMRASGGGAIVNVSSVAGRWRSLVNGVDYTTSKAAVIGFTRHLAAELAPARIRVNATCPGPTDTPMLRRSLDEEGSARLAAGLPFGRLATPQEQAAAILYLCSDDAAYVTGAVLDVNGGVF